MSLFDSLGGKKQQQQPISREQAMQEIHNDPRAVMIRCGFNIPDNITDPQQIVTYLLGSGQMGRNLRKVNR